MRGVTRVPGDHTLFCSPPPPCPSLTLPRNRVCRGHSTLCPNHSSGTLLASPSVPETRNPESRGRGTSAVPCWPCDLRTGVWASEAPCPRLSRDVHTQAQGWELQEGRWQGCGGGGGGLGRRSGRTRPAEPEPTFGLHVPRVCFTSADRGAGCGGRRARGTSGFSGTRGGGRGALGPSSRAGGGGSRADVLFWENPPGTCSSQLL